MTPSGIETGAFWLVAKCLKQMRHRIFVYVYVYAYVYIYIYIYIYNLVRTINHFPLYH